MNPSDTVTESSGAVGHNASTHVASHGHISIPIICYDNDGDYLPIVCGSVSGKLYYKKLTDAGGKGSAKCVFAKSKWLSPNEFESVGGKPKAKHWKKSLLFDSRQGLDLSGLLGSSGNVQIGTILPLLEVSSPGASDGIVNANPPSPPIAQVPINPVLSFVKAYRLKGDKDSLNRLISNKFDFSAVSHVWKTLWDSCRKSLENSGLSFHVRRDTERRSGLVKVISDVTSAFDKLDDTEDCPLIYCEACDLLKLPSLDLDPVSQNLRSNTGKLELLADNISDLKAMRSTSNSSMELLRSNNDIVEKLSACCDELRNQLTSSIASIKSDLASFKSELNTYVSRVGPPPVVNANPNTTFIHPQPTRQFDRSMNLLLFGVKEQSIVDTKALVDEAFRHLVNESVGVSDIFRLGKKPASVPSSPSRPRPVLVKVASVWQKRLILSRKFKLKEFSDGEILFGRIFHLKRERETKVKF